MITADSAKLLRLIGLGVRGRTVVVGVDQVKRSVLKGKVKLAVIAPDAAQNSLDKVLPLLAARHVRVIEAPSARELGEACGRATTAAVGVLDAQLAKGMLVTEGREK